jgi:V-type H+-transporting ATPase subunit a
VGQEIVETYGIPRYGEVNPGIFTCVTFPFFFGVMFGDIAHGLVLFSFGLFLVLMTDKLKTSSLKALLPLRYMVLMMGFFACYCGWIYNDFLGISFNLFGSCYPMPE